MKAIIAAIDRNGGIGAENDLLWQRDLPADLAHFKSLTIGKSVIMGRKTFESIGRALPDRQNIVITRQSLGALGVTLCGSISEAYDAATSDAMVIGGGQIYQETIDDMDQLYITEVHAAFPQATVFFPTIDQDQWQETSREHHDADEKNKYPFDFVTYKRLA